jgi:FlaA1/EpsC-like NDP-sugar epimerase
MSKNYDFKLSKFATKIVEEGSLKSNRGEALAGKRKLYEIDPDKSQELSELLSSAQGSEVNITEGETHVMKVGSKRVGNVDYILGNRADLDRIKESEIELERIKKPRTTSWRSVYEPLRGKTVFITGGNAGIGKETAKYLHQKGAEIHISGRNQETLGETVREIGGD